MTRCTLLVLTNNVDETCAEVDKLDLHGITYGLPALDVDALVLPVYGEEADLRIIARALDIDLDNEADTYLIR